jgi:Zn-dependent M16 (insulinase) family peptidase
MSVFRDPNSLDTLTAFNNSIKWAVEGNFTEQDIEEAKLSVFAAVSSISLKPFLKYSSTEIFSLDQLLVGNPKTSPPSR